MPDSTPRCPACHQAIPAGAPGGLCPACVLRGADEPPPAPGLPAAPSLAEVAAAFPQWEILALIGQGGMGSVYQIRQPQLDRFAALKILSPSLGGDPAFAERFNREARALGTLNHPNIVTLYEHGQAGGFFYLLMEYVDGVNLRQAMQAGRFTPEQALALVPPLCDALQAAHAQGVWHRDIKPENILLDTRGRVKIADFGIARLTGDPARNFTLTGHGDGLGSTAYVAPEQIEKPHTVDHRADIYSLGVVIYEMLTGELPLGRFRAPSRFASVDARIDEIVLRTLEKERELRQQSAAEVKTEVAMAATGAERTRGATNRPSTLPKWPALPKPIPPLVWAVALVVAGGAWFIGGLGGLVAGLGLTVLVWLLGVGLFGAIGPNVRRKIFRLACLIACVGLVVTAVALTPFCTDPWWEKGVLVLTVSGYAIGAALLARLLLMALRGSGKSSLFSRPLSLLAAAAALVLMAGGLTAAKWMDGHWPFLPHLWKVSVKFPRPLPQLAGPASAANPSPAIPTLLSNATGPISSRVLLAWSDSDASIVFRTKDRPIGNVKFSPEDESFRWVGESWIHRVLDQLPVQRLTDVRTSVELVSADYAQRQSGQRQLVLTVIALCGGAVLLATAGRRFFLTSLVTLGVVAGFLAAVPRWPRHGRFDGLSLLEAADLKREGPSRALSDFTAPDRAFSALCDAALRDGMKPAVQRHASAALLQVIERENCWERIAWSFSTRAVANVVDRTSRPPAIEIQAGFLSSSAFGAGRIQSVARYWMIEEDGEWKLDGLNLDLPSLPASTPATLLPRRPAETDSPR